MPSSQVRDLRQLLLHRYKLVIIRARVKNELQHLCLNQGVQKKRRLWSQAGQQVLRELPLKPWGQWQRCQAKCHAHLPVNAILGIAPTYYSDRGRIP